jgi:hypothetical protein
MKPLIILSLILLASCDRQTVVSSVALPEARTLKNGKQVYRFDMKTCDDCWMLNENVATWHDVTFYCPPTAIVLTPSVQPGDAVQVDFSTCRKSLVDFDR